MFFNYDWVTKYLKAAPSLQEAATLLNSTGLETEIENDGLEVEHTVNRSDAMCHYGIARELSVKGGYDMVEPPIYEGELPELSNWAIESEDAEECPQYIGVLVENVTASASPAWLKELLESIDQTSHNLLVDLTNYLLWEFSHPSHAFDADKLKGQRIVVRKATEGETLTTLDGRDHKVDGLLCITDDSGPIALAGVMGGENSEVDDKTTRLLLELAVFRPATARRTGRATNIHSDARHRFERGVDRENMDRVIRRFLYLLLQEQPDAKIIGMKNMDLAPFERADINLSRAHLDRLLGIHLSDEEVMNLLQRMDCFPAKTGDGWQVAPPGYKVDVTREVDVIEELIRFAGVDRLESTHPAFRGSDYNPDPLLIREDEVRNALVSMGFQETITFDFINEELDALMGGDGECVRLRNPMNLNQAVMRRNILPSMLNCVAANLNRGIANLSFFEIGHTFLAGQEAEPHHLAVVLTQSKEQGHWWGDVGGHIFYRVKGVFEALAERGDWQQLQVKETAPAWLESGESLGVYLGEKCIGGFGMLCGKLVETFKMDVVPAVMELDISFLHDVAARLPQSEALSEFPGMKIDVAFVVDMEHSYQKLRDHILALDLPMLESLGLFDAYEGKAVGKGKRSLGFRFRFRSFERSLTSEEITATMDKVIESVTQTFGATIRT